MRLFPAADFRFISVAAAAVLVLLMPVQAAWAQAPDNSAVQRALADAATSNNGMPPMIAPGTTMPFTVPGGYPAGFPTPGSAQITSDEMADLLKDPNSPQSKAKALALKARQDGSIINFAKAQAKKEEQSLTDFPVPPPMEDLQNVHAKNGTDYSLIEGETQEELMDLDLRKDAQREAALSYGARGGLAKRQHEISERLDGYSATLDKVFDFRSLLIKAPSGLLIEPPIVRESLDSLVITKNGNEAAVADRVLEINKQAKIVSAPRDWRNYLVTNFPSEIAPPPKVLWPKDTKEQANWNTWVRQGWEAGYTQGDDAFESGLNRLTAEYNGMVRYRMLLAEGMISQPYAMHEDRGVTGSKSEMRVGDRALRITGPSQFLRGSDLWKPADR